MADTLTVNYGGITITYNERRERFEFELRGKERYATTLKLAKEAIDRPVAEKDDSFDAFDAFTKDGYSRTSSFRPIRVTSMKEATWRGGNQYRATVKDAQSGKQKLELGAYEIVMDTQANRETMKLITDLAAQRDDITNRISEAERKLETYDHRVRKEKEAK